MLKPNYPTLRVNRNTKSSSEQDKKLAPQTAKDCLCSLTLEPDQDLIGSDTNYTHVVDIVAFQAASVDI